MNRTFSACAGSALVTSFVLACAGPALAAEGATFGGPIGFADVRSAYLPSAPGFYLTLAEVPTWSTSLNGSNGKPNPAFYQNNLEININAAILTYVYPWKPFGGTLATTVQETNFDYVHWIRNGVTQNDPGWGDPYVDILRWSKHFGDTTAPDASLPKLPYGLTVQLNASAIFPIGTYNPDKFLQVGHNDYFFVPNFALSYLTKPNFLGDGLEFSARFFYNHATTNPVTNYAQGDIVDVDAAISERVGRWQYGVAGNFATQINSDAQNGRYVGPDGRYLTLSRVGPVLIYDADWGGTFKAKFQYPVDIRNTVAAPQFVFALSFKLK
jgi:hypothetical protein